MTKNNEVPIIGDPITGSELDTWFTGHLPYRFKALAAHTKYQEGDHKIFNVLPEEVKGEILICTIEMAILSCRKFIEFLGLKVLITNDIPKLNAHREFRKYDVYVTMLGGRFVPENDLSIEGQSLIIDIYNAGNRTTAHITTGSNNQGKINRLHDAVILVGYLLKTYLYDEINKDVIVRPIPDSLLYKCENEPNLLDKYLNK